MRKSIFAALLILVCLINILPGAAAYAAERAEVTLTVGQIFVSDISTPPSEVFTYCLVPHTADAPMPAESDPDGHTFTITGTGNRQIDPITFAAAGEFVYELHSVTADQNGYTIDRRVYTIEVYVTETLEVFLVYISDGDKVAELDFTHRYQAPPSTPTPDPPTPTPNPPSTPNPPAPPDGPKGGDGPKTSDDSNPALWTALLTISSAALFFLFWAAWRSWRSREKRGRKA